MDQTEGLYQFVPPLTDEEYKQLKDDIAEVGVLMPVEYDEDGNILDGHHRVQICKELGITNWPKITRMGLTEEQKIEHAVIENINRRSLTGEQKKEIALQVIQHYPNYSFVRLAKMVGVSDMTISRWLTSTNVDVSQHEGADQKMRPANKEYAEQRHEKIRETIEEHPDWSDRKIADKFGINHSTVGRQREIVNNPPKPELEPEPEYPDYPDIAEDVEEAEERYEYSIELGEIERNLHNSIVALDTALEYITSSNNQMAGSEEFCKVIADQLDDCEAIINKYRRILRENAE